MRENIKLAETISSDINETKVRLMELLADIEKIRDEWYARYQSLIDSDSEEEIAQDARYLHNCLYLAYEFTNEAEGNLHDAEEQLDEFVAVANDAVL